jgi:hypothetical protein
LPADDGIARMQTYLANSANVLSLETSLADWKKQPM